MAHDQDRITRTPGTRSGQACIRGMRITVVDILSYLASGMTVEEVLVDFPKLERADVLAALAYAADQLRVSPGPEKASAEKK